MSLRVSRPVLLLLLIGAAAPVAADLVPRQLRCEYRISPLGIDTRRPRLSWIPVETDLTRRGQRQSAYRILVASRPELLEPGSEDLWDSGRTASDETAHVEYQGRALESWQECWWKVRVWDVAGKPSPWSEPASWTMGILDESDWKARWIGASADPGLSLGDARWIWYPEGDPLRSAPPGKRYFRMVIELPVAELRDARIALAADNSFTAFVNGREIGEGQDWNALRLFDISSAIRPGRNAICVIAQNGGTAPNPAGLIGRLVIRFEGRADVESLTDSSWRVASGAPAGWLDPSFDDGPWSQARELGSAGCEPWGTPSRSGTSSPLPILRRTFEAPKKVRRALVAVCGLGQYELYLNGEPVGDHEMDPGWTNYRRSRLYAMYDVTRLVGRGTNAIGAMLGNGMYNVTGGRYIKFRGSFGPPVLLLELRLDYEDGTTQRIASDAAWRVTEGPIRFSCIYGGEDHDARYEPRGWKQPEFDDADWTPASLLEDPGGRLLAQSAPPIKVAAVLEPRRITEPVAGVYVYDLGQNFAGRPRIRLRGPAGASVKITPAEILDAAGLASQRASGGPHHYTYTLRGEGTETWHPRFTYYGFRYLQVEGATPPDEAREEVPVVLALRGEFLRSSARRVGTFHCSSRLYERIDNLIDWAVGSNLQSVLTDCPHREKLGWLEVAHLMGPSILGNYDVATLYAKIARDTSESQLPNGLVPDIAPEYTVFSGGFRDSPEWGSASVLLPWLLYRWYGDRRVLQASYETMKRYVDYLATRADGHILRHGLGDWADFVKGGGVGASQLTPRELTATAIYWKDIRVLAKVAGLLGQTSDAEKYDKRASGVKAAFHEKLFDPQRNCYATGSQTSLAMPLALGLVDHDRRPAVVENLVRQIRKRDYITAGDVGFRYLLRALADADRSDRIFDLTHRTTLPGYGYQLEQGATSLTEAWDGRRVVSHNHCMLGHIQEWFRKDVVGIQQDHGSVAFRRIVVRPRIVGDLTGASGHYDSIRGRIESRWRLLDDRLELDVAIPPGTTARVHVPTSDATSVTESGKPIAEANGVTMVAESDEEAVLRIVSGHYRFRAVGPR